MPLDDERNALLSTFERPAGSTEGPQVFEVSFDLAYDATDWMDALRQGAEEIGVEYRTNTTPEGKGCTILLGILDGDDYPKLMQAMQPYLDENIKRSEQYAEEMLPEYIASLQ